MPESINDTMSDLYSALSRGDITWFQERLVFGPANIHIGAAASYWLTTPEFITELERQFRDISVAWEAGQTRFEEKGETAWAVDRPTIRFSDGSVMQCRLSVVFARQGEQWHLAHSHLSVGAE